MLKYFLTIDNGINHVHTKKINAYDVLSFCAENEPIDIGEVRAFIKWSIPGDSMIVRYSDKEMDFLLIHLN